MEEEQGTRDWLVMETIQPEKRLKQMTLDLPLKVKKTGSNLNSQMKLKKVETTRRKKISKKEGEEIRKTSLNIFDWFCEKRTGHGTSLGPGNSGASLESANPVVNPSILLGGEQTGHYPVSHCWW